MIAAHLGQIDAVSCLIDHGADHTIRDNGCNALFFACIEGHLEVMKVLIEKGMDINRSIDGDGSTALMIAAHERHSAIVEYLCKHPKLRCINAKDGGITALHYSCQRKSISKSQSSYLRQELIPESLRSMV